MSTKTAVLTTKAPAPLPVLSQAVVHNGMIYCSGSIGMDPKTNQLVSGGVAERTHQALRNLSAVLEAGGNSLKNVVKTNVFISTMDDFAEMNKVYQSYFKDEPKPQLPLDTDIEIECIAYLYEPSTELPLSMVESSN
ncbi:uncharacterized protein ARB_01828 [Trichophyton benhamiae CBS 112371]|uniref:Uncharacterized protein n=1 Tax=Arthroderma benhamiae (strain ATCC MYA-4681 / CBS 112371) TaxID=663331 RepID=D4B057_ARTBC|nr:uncharacterized protein ARB_01828 [Trichophyton benhamiae CBS 112371]EFE31209.1 hypothetical protein ARB_01828 [Trichophyton benhamiae CBS 112371]